MSSPTPIGDLLHTPKYEVKNHLLKQSDMSENLVEAVVSDIDKLRYPVEPGMTFVIEPVMTHSVKLVMTCVVTKT